MIETPLIICGTFWANVTPINRGDKAKKIFRPFGNEEDVHYLGFLGVTPPWKHIPAAEGTLNDIHGDSFVTKLTFSNEGLSFEKTYLHDGGRTARCSFTRRPDGIYTGGWTITANGIPIVSGEATCMLTPIHPEILNKSQRLKAP